jgi:hypothetical protein
MTGPPMVVIVLALEEAPRVVTLAGSPGEERRVVDWLLDGTRDDRVRDLVDAATRLVTQRPEEAP